MMDVDSVTWLANSIQGIKVDMLAQPQQKEAPLLG